MDKYEHLGIDDYELKEWIGTLGSMPIKRHYHEDHSQPYGMEMAHVFELENGKFALVVESGCSCYEPSKAGIELFPTLLKAKEQFDKWDKENRHNNN